ncbi:MAG TPA: hypothetical protein PKL56_00520 [Cyclobacteriaceae bacterium]|nr:hypothetical protein [Cyclobacteriaceae bacterium]HMV10276.1 hypothetical protein [Cyclobacteriaceae bacterium]HMV89656.1 hypothetical protein [Cyclobacteriaceae bacterium]HMW99756.1 hypothetical protein [Cyclobacteriaceae bacterium]HMX50148.1 hypothetical protein [Cyclobacteriaceae bacterium]
MKNLSYLLVCAVVMFVAACSDDDSNNNPTIKENELSMIVPRTNGSGNALLFKDGTLANPKSGIDAFESRSAGSKLLLSYKTLGKENGMLNIAVTSYAKADDSTFTVDPTPAMEEEVYAKSFSGTYYTYDHDSTDVSAGSLTLSFEAKGVTASVYHYAFTPEEGSAISGSGKFTANNQTITFEDNEDSDFVVPTGNFSLWFNDGMLYLWKVGENGEFFSYALKQD